ncbi:hypothetical protein Vadar_032542 [Vaccinium darrowii]|uniref:Uncharacterized protein n=1 Tax=Vaccinium darrowii TaxID=229202 RepID=A0ACB7YI01_9ERIC|nr:hypothetical protein Vadar_032542 [Vaccinium darrowii]
MAKNSADAKWAETEVEEDEEEEEEEEALSLCDLPINNQQNHQPTKEQKQEEEAAAAVQPIKTEEDFDFKSLIGSVLTEPQMCAADDVFFQGQIIPLRHSISSEGGLTAAFSSRCVSRSESMDRFHVLTGLNFNSVTNSRSSSVRSSLHSSSSGSSSTITTTTTTNQKHKVLNQFHSHPSPSPQIRIPSRRHSNSGNRVQKSSVWSFFRVGLVHTPEIELQGLKNRSGSRNSNKSGGFGSRNSNSSSSSSASSIEKKKKKMQRFFNGGGCRCSVDAVETVPLRAVIVKEEEEEGGEKEKEKGKKTKKEKKQTVSRRHRTFEWLKELSDAGVPD